jgi:glycosyltransferase involved in cell wall biosynthesis
MRIVFDATEIGLQPVGGVSRVCNEVLERMAKANPDFRFLVVVPIMKGQRLPKHPSIKIATELGWPRRRLFAFLNRISRAWTDFRIRAFRPHIYQVSHYQAPRLKGIPQVALVHDFVDEHTFNGMGGNGLYFTRHIAKRLESCDAVVAVSHATKADIVRHANVPAEKIRVAHLGVDEAFLSGAATVQTSPLVKANGSKPYFLFVGSRFGYKNFGTVLRAWAMVRQSGFDCQLMCVGGSDHLEAGEMDFLIQANLVRDLVMVGQLSEAGLREVYANAVAFIFPSLAEGFGLPLVEAMAAGCRVIASDIPVFREIANDSVIFFNPYSVNDLVAAMTQCLRNPPDPAKISAAVDYVRNFSWDKTAAVFAETYRALAKR